MCQRCTYQTISGQRSIAESAIIPELLEDTKAKDIHPSTLEYVRKMWREAKCEYIGVKVEVQEFNPKFIGKICSHLSTREQLDERGMNVVKELEKELGKNKISLKRIFSIRNMMNPKLPHFMRIYAGNGYIIVGNHLGTVGNGIIRITGEADVLAKIAMLLYDTNLNGKIFSESERDGSFEKISSGNCIVKITAYGFSAFPRAGGAYLGNRRETFENAIKAALKGGI